MRTIGIFSKKSKALSFCFGLGSCLTPLADLTFLVAFSQNVPVATERVYICDRSALISECPLRPCNL